MVKRVGESRVYQVDVPADEPARSLAALVASNLGWDREPEATGVGYDVEVFPPGRMLRLDESLDDANCPDGTWMVLHPRSAEPTEEVGYVWRRLDSHELDDDRDVQGYVWKQLDQDENETGGKNGDRERLDKQNGRLAVQLWESRNVVRTASR